MTPGTLRRGDGPLGPFKHYPAYKDSGAEWLGQIPEHWQARRLKRLFHVANGATPASGVPEFWDGDIPWVTPEDLGALHGWRIRDTRRCITPKGYRSCGTTLVPRGSIVLSTRAPIGHLAVADIELCTNQGCRSLIFRRGLPRQYFYYQLIAARGELESWGQGSTFRELATGNLEDIVVADPPETEQRIIAGFLDRETAKIDALVAKEGRLIEVLQEKRSALITHAVTKGLDSKVPMQESGVEWLGQIPAHWEVMALKAISSLQTGVTLGKRYEDAQPLTVRPYLRVANVQDGYLALDDIAEIEVPANEARRHELQAGDVLMTEGGDFDKLGRGHVWEGQIAGCLHQNHIFAVRPNQSVLHPQFLAAVMTSAYGRAYFTATSKQSTNLASTNSTKLKNFPTPVPPKDEEEGILRFLAAQTSRIDLMADRVREAIDLLNELRSALVSAAVTGRIDVREEVA